MEKTTLIKVLFVIATLSLVINIIQANLQESIYDRYNQACEDKMIELHCIDNISAMPIDTYGEAWQINNEVVYK